MSAAFLRSATSPKEIDPVGHAFRAGGPQPVVDAVVAQRALVDGACPFAQGDHPEGAGRYAVLAADADVLPDVDVSQVGTDDGAGGAGVQAAGIVAMLARIAREEPPSAGAVLAELLDEADVPPIGGAQGAGVVVGVAGEVDGDGVLLHGIEPEMAGFVGKGVPFLARHLACLAPGADGGVDEHPFRHLGPTSFFPARMAQVNTFPSWIETLGSPTRAAQVVHHVSLGGALPAPVPRQADFVDGFPVDEEWPHAPRDERPCLDLAAGRPDRRVLPVPDPPFGREFRGDLAEKLGHQLRQPGEPAAHRARSGDAR